MVTEWVLLAGLLGSWAVMLHLAKKIEAAQKQLDDVVSVVRVLRHHLMKQMEEER